MDINFDLNKLENIVGKKIKLITTKCVVNEIENIGKILDYVLIKIKNFE